jgi:hypothetical protein
LRSWDWRAIPTLLRVPAQLDFAAYYVAARMLKAHAIGTTVMLVITPVVWDQYFVHLLLPLVLLASVARAQTGVRGAGRRMFVTGTATVLALCVVVCAEPLADALRFSRGDAVVGDHAYPSRASQRAITGAQPAFGNCRRTKALHTGLCALKACDSIQRCLARRA